VGATPTEQAGTTVALTARLARLVSAAPAGIASSTAAAAAYALLSGINHTTPHPSMARI
jgi:hypothetical protein